MYEVTLINSDEEIIINAVSISQDAPRVTGTVKQGINCFNSFTFTIYPNNPGYEKVYPYKSKVKVYNTLKGKYEFIGRVLTPSASMDEDGVACKEYVCESELAYLCDSQQRYREYHDYTPRAYLEALVAVHNAGVETDKQFVVGNVTVTDPNNSIYRYSDYKSTWENIKEDLLNTLGGELQVRYEGDIRYLDYLAETGETCITKIKLGHNMKSASENLDINELYTRIIPLGAKIKTTDENGNEVETDERLTIASVNNGIDYLDYQDGINQYGIIQGTVIWDDVTTASELFKKAQEYINSLTISLSNEITAYDLSLIGLDIDSFEVGNYYPVENELLNINYTLRVIEKTINIENPAESTLTFGKQAIDIKTYNALKQQETKKNLETAIKKLKEIQNSIGVIASEKVNAYDEVLNQTALLQKLVDGDYDGLYLDENGRLFIKGTYVATGILASAKLKTGSTTEPISWINLDDGTFSFGSDSIAYDGDNLKVKGDIYATNFSADDNIYIVDSATVHSGILWCTSVDAFDASTMPYIWGDCAEPNLDLVAGSSSLLLDSNGTQLGYFTDSLSSYMIADKNSITINYGQGGYIYLDGEKTNLGSTRCVSNIYAKEFLTTHIEDEGNVSEIKFHVTSTFSSFYPFSTNLTYLGTSSANWSGLYVDTAPVVASDRNKKHDINYDMSQYEKMFELLKPSCYRMNDGTSNRIHTGFIAQDLEDAMNTTGIDSLNLAAFIKSPRYVQDENGKDTEEIEGYDYAIRYEELIALNTHMIQKMQSKIEELEERLNG